MLVYFGHGGDTAGNTAGKVVLVLSRPVWRYAYTLMPGAWHGIHIISYYTLRTYRRQRYWRLSPLPPEREPGSIILLLLFVFKIVEFVHSRLCHVEGRRLVGHRWCVRLRGGGRGEIATLIQGYFETVDTSGENAARAGGRIACMYIEKVFRRWAQEQPGSGERGFPRAEGRPSKRARKANRRRGELFTLSCFRTPSRWGSRCCNHGHSVEMKPSSPSSCTVNYLEKRSCPVHGGGQMAMRCDAMRCCAIQ